MKKLKKKEVQEDLIIPEITHDRSLINYSGMDNFSASEDYVFKPNPVASKFSGELFREDLAEVPGKLIRVKHTQSSNSEKWRIFDGNKNIFTLEGRQLQKKEREFLRSVEGARFLLERSKIDGITVIGLKKEMRSKLTKELSVKSKKRVK